MYLKTLSLTFLLLLAACGSADAPQPEETGEQLPVTSGQLSVISEQLSVASGQSSVTREQPMVIDLDAIPPVDTSQHNVPLEEVYFDTFRRTNRAVPLSDADPELIRSLLDAIPPIYNPIFETAVSATWLDDADLILGYADGDEAFAYPIRILNFHEVVSHEVNGRSVAATYCPLCRSGIVYDRQIDGHTLLFGNTSALHESDMVMVDHQTGSYWAQVSGTAIVGTLTGTQLEVLPSQMSSWGQWQALHPDTVVLSQDTGHSRNYSRDPFAGIGNQYTATGNFAFPVSEAGRDARLDPGEIVLGVEIDGETRAYPLAEIGDGVVADVVGETAVAIFSLSDGPTAAAFVPIVDGIPLTFSYSDGLFRDAETGSSWNMGGTAVSGELAGSQLEALPTRSTFWFSMVASFPDVTVWKN